MKKVIILMMLSILFIACMRKPSKHSGPYKWHYPSYFEVNLPSPLNYSVKTAAYWTKPTMAISEAINLASHDLLIVDLENKFNNYYSLVALKHMNPEIKILAYSNPMEIFLTKYSNRTWQNQIIDEIINNRSQWLLRTVNYNNGSMSYDFASFWPGMTMLNLSASCPEINCETYSEWMANKLSQEILIDSIWDGYFQDNGSNDIAWTHPGKIDIDGDLRADADKKVDREWEKGMTTYLNVINYHLGSDKIVVLNKGDNNFRQQSDGKFFEKFPNDYLGDTWALGWRQCLHNATKQGDYVIFQVLRHEIMFGLASSLLLDNVYLAIGQDDAGTFAELSAINLGRPLEKYQKNGTVFSRRYENGLVKVEPLLRTGEIIQY